MIPSTGDGSLKICPEAMIVSQTVISHPGASA